MSITKIHVYFLLLCLSVYTKLIVYNSNVWQDSYDECTKNGRMVSNKNDKKDLLKAEGLAEVWSKYSIQWFRLRGKTRRGLTYLDKVINSDGLYFFYQFMPDVN